MDQNSLRRMSLRKFRETSPRHARPGAENRIAPAKSTQFRPVDPVGTWRGKPVLTIDGRPTLPEANRSCGAPPVKPVRGARLSEVATAT